METKNEAVAVRINHPLVNEIREIAQNEFRSVTKQIELMLWQQLQEWKTANKQK